MGTCSHVSRLQKPGGRVHTSPYFFHDQYCYQVTVRRQCERDLSYSWIVATASLWSENGNLKRRSTYGALQNSCYHRIDVRSFFRPGTGTRQDHSRSIIDLGYTASNGVNTTMHAHWRRTLSLTGSPPSSGFSYGGAFNVFLSEAISAGFNFAQQNSKLEGRIVGGSKEEFDRYDSRQLPTGFSPLHRGGRGLPHEAVLFGRSRGHQLSGQQPADPVNLPSAGYRRG